MFWVSMSYFYEIGKIVVDSLFLALSCWFCVSFVWDWKLASIDSVWVLCFFPVSLNCVGKKFDRFASFSTLVVGVQDVLAIVEVRTFARIKTWKFHTITGNDYFFEVLVVLKLSACEYTREVRELHTVFEIERFGSGTQNCCVFHPKKYFRIIVFPLCLLPLILLRLNRGGWIVAKNI